MDALFKATAAMLAVIAALAPMMLSDDSDASGGMDGLMLYQVNPFECEGVAVHNYGAYTVDMSEYMISDMPPGRNNEGSVTFDRGVTVAPGETLVIVSEISPDAPFSQQDNVVIMGVDGVNATSRFMLANDGDDIYLYRDGSVVDAVFYGNADVVAPYWDGPTVEIPDDRWIQRTGTDDTDSADDWMQYVYGGTNEPFDPDKKFDATVTPFLFPDSGGVPIYEALESATESIWIEMYQLGSKNVISLLSEKASAGVEVRVLLEGESLDGGYDPIISAGGHWLDLIDNGGEVRLIGVGDHYNRFQFDHAKFAVIDGDTTIVTSENWTTENMNGSMDDDPYDSGTRGNRGWGAIVESTGYSEYMADVFLNDWSMEYGDVKGLTDVYENLTHSDTFYVSPEDWGEFPSYSAKVTPVLSCDNSYQALLHYASIAEERLYSQQQSLGDGFNDFEDKSPVMIFNETANRGVDVRVVFSDNISKSLSDSINARTNVKTAVMEAPYVHNKGVICDDIVWVSSVNWTETSFFENRECCVVIESREIADYFTEAFLSDFDRFYTYGGFTAYLDGFETSYGSGEEFVITVVTDPSGDAYTYEWDLGDGSDVRTTDVNRITVRPADGDHTLTVRITNSEGMMRELTAEYTVGESSTSAGGDDASTGLFEGNLQYIIAALVVVLFAVAAAVRSRSGKKRSNRRHRWGSS